MPSSSTVNDETFKGSRNVLCHGGHTNGHIQQAIKGSVFYQQSECVGGVYVFTGDGFCQRLKLPCLIYHLHDIELMYYSIILERFSAEPKHLDEDRTVL